MPIKRLHLIVGLGNPGDHYVKTRHNAGFMVVDEVAEAFSIPFKRKKFDVSFGRGNIEHIETILAKPIAFMNRSGHPVQKLAQYFKISCEDMLVVHDDIDLAFGRLKIKKKGGDGGHKGLRSLIDAFGQDDFVRIRIGIGRSKHGIGVADHVLGRFGLEEEAVLKQIITKTKDAVVTVLCKGIEDGMNKFHNKKLMC